MTCWVKLPTPALPDQVQGDPKLRFVSISAEDAPQRLFLCPTYYTRPPLIVKPFKFYPHDSPGFTRFLQCSFICTGYTAAVLKSTQSDRWKKSVFSAGLQILKPSPREGGPGRMRGSYRLRTANGQPWQALPSSVTTVTASVSAPEPPSAVALRHAGVIGKRTQSDCPLFIGKIYLLILIGSAPGSTAGHTSTSLKSSVFVTTVITTAG